MADPTSKIILTAEDRSAAGWASFQRNGQQAMDATVAKVRVGATAMASAFAAAFGGFAVAGMYQEFIAKTTESVGGLKDLQDAFGATADGLSRIRAGAALTGVPMEEVGSALNKLAKSMQAAKNPLSEEAAALKALGINTKEFLALTPDQALIRVSEKMQDYADGTEKAAVATALLGKSGPLFLKMLNDIAEVGDGYKKLTQDEINAADEFDKALKRTGRAMDDFKVGVGNAIIPGLLDIISYTKRAQENMGWLAGTIAGVVGGVGLKALGVDINEMRVAERQVTELFTSLAKAKKELADQQELKSKGLGFQFIIDRNIKSAQADIEKYTTELKGAIQWRDKLANELKTGGAPKKEGIKFDGAPRKEGTPEKENLNLGQDTAAAASYAKAMADIMQAQRAAEAGGRELTASQKALFDLMQQPDWQRMPQLWKDVLIEQAAIATEAELAAAQTKRLNDLLAATDSAKLEKTRADMMLLASAFEDGKISAEQFEEAARAALGKLATDGKDEFADLLQAIEGWGRDASRTIAETMLSGKASLGSFRDYFGKILTDMAAMLIQRQVTQPLIDAVLSAGGATDKKGTGFDVGKALGSLWDMLPSFDVGTPYVPRDMLAKIHEGERIVTRADNAAGNYGPGGDLAVHNTFILQGTPDLRTQNQIAARTAESVARARRRNS